MIGIADRDEITQLVHRYGHHVDRLEYPAVVALFTEDGVLALPDPPAHLDPVRVRTGRAEILDTLESRRGIVMTRHAALGLVIDGGTEADQATGSVIAVAHHLTDRADRTTTDLVWHLRYTDDYRRVAGRWLVARRSLAIDWIESRPVRARRTVQEPR